MPGTYILQDNMRKKTVPMSTIFMLVCLKMRHENARYVIFTYMSVGIKNQGVQCAAIKQHHIKHILTCFFKTKPGIKHISINLSCEFHFEINKSYKHLKLTQTYRTCPYVYEISWKALNYNTYNTYIYISLT